MQSVQQIINSSPHVASSAGSVASALAKPRATGSTTTAPTTSTSSTSTSGSSTSSDDTITANDFLTLLVAEMQNQDPTQPTDPNEYISQMVDINSLQQLIGINQGVTSLDTAAGVPASTSGDTVSGTSSAQ